jgi:hypothetical protein
MSNRASKIVVLCEDDEHMRLTLAYMKRCGIQTERVVVQEVASRKQYGGNDAWVLREFPRQLRACRNRATRAETLLVVLIDGDRWTVDQRCQQLNQQLKQENQEELQDGDPVALLIPCRHAISAKGSLRVEKDWIG